MMSLAAYQVTEPFAYCHHIVPSQRASLLHRKAILIKMVRFTTNVHVLARIPQSDVGKYVD